MLLGMMQSNQGQFYSTRSFPYFAIFNTSKSSLLIYVSNPSKTLTVSYSVAIELGADPPTWEG